MGVKNSVKRNSNHDQIKEITELRTILNSSNNGIIVVNKRGIISKCNPSALRILGLEEKKVIGENLEIIFPSIDREKMLHGTTGPYRDKVKTQDKILVYDLIPLKIEGINTGSVIIFRDISAFENISNELEAFKNLSRKLDAVIESSYDGIYITDGEANTLKVNKAYERITGLNRKNMIGRNMADLVKEGYISKSGSLSVLKNKKTVSIAQKFSTGKKALITSTPIFGENKEITMIVTNVRDVTDLSRLKRELEKNEQLVKKYYSEIEELKLQLMNTSDLIIEDEKMIEVMRIAKRVARVDTTVLLLGESGVGKEEVAKFIHKNSGRSRKQFIKINCGAIPKNLIESELFGYEKGAFTGASKEGKLGLFEVANGGTLFLDEVGELPMDMQVKLLRVLQEQELKRVGGVKPIKIDVRIISATNRNLKEMVEIKKFREDLYYRLNVIPIIIPPLRDRKQDILKLTSSFLHKLNKKYGWNKTFSGNVLNVFYDYDWPGNIRELKNVIERVVIISNNDTISCKDLPSSLRHDDNYGSKLEFGIMPLRKAVAKIEKRLIDESFKKYGNVRDAAKALEIDASTYVRKRKKLADVN